MYLGQTSRTLAIFLSLCKRSKAIQLPLDSTLESYVYICTYLSIYAWYGLLLFHTIWFVFSSRSIHSAIDNNISSFLHAPEICAINIKSNAKKQQYHNNHRQQFVCRDVLFDENRNIASFEQTPIFASIAVQIFFLDLRQGFRSEINHNKKKKRRKKK